MKILVIEDEEVVVRATTRTLRGAGYEVAQAGDAIAAISAARRELPDLVILDLGLPAGSGTAVLERLRALTITSLTPVIVVTGGASSNQVMDLDAAGVDAILQKLVSPQALLEAVEAALSEDVVD